jgi:hypothetical protein
MEQCRVWKERRREEGRKREVVEGGADKVEVSLSEFNTHVWGKSRKLMGKLRG